MDHVRNIFLFGFLAIFSTFFTTPNAQAAHISGMEISYRYIGDSTGIARHYEVQLSVYNTYAFTNINLPNTYNVCIRSSCFSNSNISVNIEPGTPANGVPVENQDECVERTDPAFIEVRVYKYLGYVELAGDCADWRFSAATACCRIGSANTVNYANTQGGGLYVEAMLNNTQGQNTSPQFLTPPVKSFCTNNFFVWSQAASEPDQDSVNYRFGTGLVSNAACTDGTPMPFAAGFSETAPLDVAPGTAVVINDNGTFEFTTGGNQGNYVIKIVVDEYRLHSNPNIGWIQVGSSERDMLVNLVGTCRQSVGNGPQINTNIPGYYNDFIPTDVAGIIGNNYPIPNDSTVTNPPGEEPGDYFNWPVVDYSCFDTVITLEFDVNIQCSSISPDASEFRLVGPDSTLRPVVEVIPNCNVAQETQRILLRLHRPLSIDGDYYLYIKEGSDGNTLLNACGFPLDEFFTMVIRVSDCPEPVYDLKNVTVINNDHIQLFWEYDSFPPEVVEAWNIYRSDDDGATFSRVERIEHNNAGFDTTWIDFSVTNQDVNSQSYRYSLELQMGGEVFPETRNVTSIYLRRFELGDGSWDLEWNEYDGWDNPEYELMLFEGGNWNPVQAGGNPTFATNTNFVLPEDEGDYAIRIDGHDTAVRDIQYISESNYIYFTIDDEIEEEDLIIPNVFTPNGDGENDLYEIQGLQNFQRAHLVVTNRWGNRVFESENYGDDDPWPGVDQKSGAQLPDGVYFFILRLYGGPNGDKVESGQITIFSGSN